jgi:HEAT repeat protein
VKALRKGIKDKINLVSARAAQVTAEMHLRELVPDLLAAYGGLFENAAAADKQCAAKIAMARALAHLDYREHAPFLRGLRYRQMEAGWGAPVDTAIPLRGICALALAACNDLTRAMIFRHLIDTLTDEAAVVRVEAARAIAAMDGEEAALMLRLKAKFGGEEPSVIGQVFDSLLEVEREGGLPFLAEFLRSEPEEIQAEAAISAGSSRLPAGVDLLLDELPRVTPQRLRNVILRGLSASRQPRAIEFLIGLLGRESDDAAGAMDALALHRESAPIREAVEAAMRSASTEMQGRFSEKFGR